MKTIIVISGRSSTGKTASVIEIRKKMIEKGGVSQDFKPLAVDDFTDEVSYNGKEIVFLSLGDPVEDHYDLLDPLARKVPDIYICTSRTRGSTIANVKRVAAEYGYEIIRTSNYRGEQGGTMPNGVKLNSLFADSIVNLVDNL